MSAGRYCTFFLGELFLGVTVDAVQEVIRGQELTRVPLAPPAVRGLMNLRGRIVTAIDLRRRLGLDDLPADRPPMNVVVRTAGGPVSLLVDRIGDVLEVAAEAVEPPPEALRGPGRDLVRGACPLPDRLLVVLDADRAAALPAAPAPVTV